ncbi:MAG: sensor histidine kinase [Oscillospiraceae bacterium]
MRNRVRTFRTKLMTYFLLFAAIIFTVLWVLQTVFLQSFYNSMLRKNTRAAAQEISDCGGDAAVIDRLARENSLIVYLTDTEGNIIYSSDEYKGSYTKDYGPYGTGGAEENPYRSTEEHMSWQEAAYRALPDNYGDFLEALESSGGSSADCETEDMYAYGSYLSTGEVLYVGTALDPVGGTVGIIRVQLVWVMFFSLLTGFVLAYFISGKFSAPVKEISEQAAGLGTAEYVGVHSKGFCRELDGLALTLDSSNEKLVRAEAFQRELLADISHDLRTPLTLIRGYAESIRDFSGGDKNDAAEDAAVIIKEADRLTSLVSEILEYSTLRSEDGANGFETSDMGALAERVISQFEPLFAHEGGVIEKNIAEGLYVNGNGAQLERVVYNLVDNAIRHTGDSRKITVSVFGTPEGRVRTEVRDYGSGIPADRLPYVWDRYYTARQRGSSGGSGLGLAIVKRIAELHGGSCSVQSSEGMGSVFCVELDMSKNVDK